MGDMSRAQRRNSLSTSRSRSRKNSVADEGWPDVDEMDEDEQMVEDLLAPSSPMSASATAPNFAPYSNPQLPSTSSSSRRQSQSNGYPEPNSGSLFTTTDPFYIAQLQASQNPQPAPNSIFAQTGRPAQQSPFIQHSYNHYAQAVPASAAYQR